MATLSKAKYVQQRVAVHALCALYCLSLFRDVNSGSRAPCEFSLHKCIGVDFVHILQVSITGRKGEMKIESSRMGNANSTSHSLDATAHTHHISDYERIDSYCTFLPRIL